MENNIESTIKKPEESSSLKALLESLDKEIGENIEIKCVGCNKILPLRDACRPEHDNHISHKATNDFNRGLNLAQERIRAKLK